MMDWLDDLTKWLLLLAGGNTTTDGVFLTLVRDSKLEGSHDGSTS